jgi:hypothetical protein
MHATDSMAKGDYDGKGCACHISHTDWMSDAMCCNGVVCAFYILVNTLCHCVHRLQSRFIPIS